MTNLALQNLGITTLNPMQLAAIKVAETHKEIILYAPTGSGKTLAYLLPAITNLDLNKKVTQLIVIVPTRELAIQINDVVKKLQINCKTSLCYGGHETRVERNNLIEAPTIIIGTPGRVVYHIKNKNIVANNIKTIVLDEFDKALEFGFAEDMKYIIDFMHKLEYKYLVSATVLKELPGFLRIKSINEVNYLTNTKELLPDITYFKCTSIQNDKFDILSRLCMQLQNDLIMIFCNHRDAVDRISLLLAEHSVPHASFHGGMEQLDREQALIKFRNGSSNIFITTDLASRGLDIPAIKHVIHYQLPTEEAQYIHRNGRTARMQANGQVLVLLTETDTTPVFIAKNLKEFKLTKEFTAFNQAQFVTLYFNLGKKNKVNKIDVVGFLIQQTGLQKIEIGKIEVLDFSSYVAIPANKFNEVLRNSKGKKLKGLQVKIGLCR